MNPYLLDTAMRLLTILSMLGLVGMGLAVGVARPLQAQENSIVGERVACAAGQAAGFPCRNVTLLSFLRYDDIGADSLLGGGGLEPWAALTDLWGWTDAATGRDYALVAHAFGTAFVDISDPVNPVYLGKLPGSPVDIKVYANHAFIIGMGMQVFDLRQLRAVSNPPATFAETAFYDAFEYGHNIALNEATGFAYIVGSMGGGETCGGGLHIINVQDPVSPTFVGCFADVQAGAGYTHDAQCVIYQGFDAAYRGREICLASNVTAISLIDVTDKEAPHVIARATYPDVEYVHQGWLTEDHRYFLQDDEGDERRSQRHTRTLIWDLQDLDEPILLTEYFGVSTSIDHNQYVVGRFVFQANYTSGLRILDISDITHPVEVAFFDTFPEHDAIGIPGTGILIFQGAWGTYPFFTSGVVVVSSVGEGLFVLQPTGLVQVTTERPEVPDTVVLEGGYPNPFQANTTLRLTVPAPQAFTIDVYDMLGRAVAVLHEGTLAAGRHRFTLDARDLPSGSYLVRAQGTSSMQSRIVTVLK